MITTKTEKTEENTTMTLTEKAILGKIIANQINKTTTRFINSNTKFEKLRFANEVEALNQLLNEMSNNDLGIVDLVDDEWKVSLDIESINNVRLNLALEFLFDARKKESQRLNRIAERKWVKENL